MKNKILLAIVTCMMSLQAMAQFRVEVSGVGLTQVPVAIPAFRGEESSPQKLSAIVMADLERSGQFRGTESVAGVWDEASRPDMSVWRQKGADALVTGSVTRLADGRFDVRFRLWDVVRGQGQDLGGQSYGGQTHLAFEDSQINIKEIVSILPSDAEITLETSNDLEKTKRDLEFIKNLVKNS